MKNRNSTLIVLSLYLSPAPAQTVLYCVALPLRHGVNLPRILDPVGSDLVYAVSLPVYHDARARYSRSRLMRVGG